MGKINQKVKTIAASASAIWLFVSILMFFGLEDSIDNGKTDTTAIILLNMAVSFFCYLKMRGGKDIPEAFKDPDEE